MNIKVNAFEYSVKLHSFLKIFITIIFSTLLMCNSQ